MDLFPSSGEKGEKTPTQLGPLERANLNQWTWGRKQIQFPKWCVFKCLEYRTMEKSKKPSNPVNLEEGSQDG
jgi:hypothetical protein